MRIATITLIGFLAAGCSESLEPVETEDGWSPAGKGDLTGATHGALRVSEVLPVGEGPDGPFVELLNVGAAPVDLVGWKISLGRRRVTLAAIDGHPHVVAPGEMALVADGDAGPAWAPLVTPRGAALADLLASSRRIILRDGAGAISDQADASRPPTVAGIALERRGTEGGFVASPLGSTPGGRNSTHDERTIRAYFTRPTYEQTDPVAPVFAEVVGQAQSSLHGAFYQINNMDLVAALAGAERSGVDVGIVTDDEWYFKTGSEGPRYARAYGALTDAGIPVVWDTNKAGAPRASALMHSKFMVIDDRTVWTGSYNLISDEDPTQPETHADNALVLESPVLAALHEREYHEMADLHRFGTAKRYDDMTDRSLLVTGHEVDLDGARLTAFFAPKYQAMDAIIRACADAHSSIHFAAFSFYHPALGAAMIRRSQQGVDVRGVFYNASTGGTSSQYPPMIAAGLDVRMPDAAEFPIFLHDKFIVIDHGDADPIVITGSLNFSSNAAEQNDEALYVIHDRYLADAYYAVWRSLYDPAVGKNKDTGDVADVVISEVYPAPAAAAVSAAPFVELRNRGPSVVDLAGLRLVNPRSGAAAVTALVAGGATVLAPGARVVLWTSDRVHLGAGDDLMLLDGRGRMVATFDAPRFAGPGLSLNRDEAPLDREAAWAAAQATPGQ